MSVNLTQPQCDFCGSVNEPRCYPADVSGYIWHACKDCAGLIRGKHWERLIDRIVRAYAARNVIPPGEQHLFRIELRRAIAIPSTATEQCGAAA